MRRRWLAGLPVLTGAVAAAVHATDPSPLAGILGAAAVGGVAAVGAAGVLQRRASRLAARLGASVTGAAETSEPLDTLNELRELGEPFEVVGAAMQHRIDTVAGERERIVRLLERLPVAILLVDRDRLAFANAAAGRLLGIDPRHARGREAGEVLEAPDFAKAVRSARESAEETEAEARRRGRDLVARAVPTSRDEVALLVTDLTEARRVDAMRRDFVANASHELKTPVAGLQALAESLALALDRDPERARGMAERIEHEAARLAATTRDLLDLARLEEAGGEGPVQRIDLADIVRAQLERVAPQASERGLDVDSALVVGAMVEAAPEDLRLIVGNLLENAVRYNREGGWVSVTLRRAGGALALDVADSGIGIPEADQDRVFERFYRVDKGRSRAQGGTGLGLSLVRNAAQRHGGSVSVRSILGEGSTFTVMLPAAPLE